MNKALLAIAAGLLTLSIISVGSVSFAADDTSCPPGPHGEITLCNPLGANATLPGLLKNFFTQAVKIITILVPLIVIFGAFQMVFAAGNPEKFATGRNTIVYTVIGYVIILAAQGIVAIVQKLLTPSL